MFKGVVGAEFELRRFGFFVGSGVKRELPELSREPGLSSEISGSSKYLGNVDPSEYPVSAGRFLVLFPKIGELNETKIYPYMTKY